MVRSRRRPGAGPLGPTLLLLLPALLLPACAARVRRPVFLPATGQAALLDQAGAPLAWLQASILTATFPVAPGASEGEVQVAVRLQNTGAGGTLEVQPGTFRLFTADLQPLPAARLLEGPEERRLAPEEEVRWVLSFPVPAPAAGAEPPDSRSLLLEWQVRDQEGRTTRGTLPFTARPRRPRAWPWTWSAWPPPPWYHYGYGYATWPPYGWYW